MLKKISKIILVAIFSLATFFNGRSQTRELRKAYKEKMAEVNFYYEVDNFHLALPPLMELYNYDSLSTEVNYKIGICTYFVKRDKTEAIKYFEFAKDSYIDSYYYLGRLYHLQMKFDRAIDYYNHYKNRFGEKYYSDEEVQYHIDISNTAEEKLASPINANILNIGSAINSEHPDYAPVISPDNTFLLFTSRREGGIGNLKDPYGEYFEDIYISYKEGDSWSKPKNIGLPVNTQTHDACVTLSSDGKKLYFFRTNRELTGGDIFVSEKTEHRWSEPQIIKTEINTRKGKEASITISPDENHIYFSSTRSGGYGGQDIYKISKLPNGEWSKAQNLGPAINTPYDEDSPFIHPDGGTLYFSSKGHQNIGGYDIFKSELDENGLWSEPENLGYPVNTVKDDIYFIMTNDKKIGYFSSNRDGGYGLSDIYTLETPDNISDYIMITGRVRSDDDTEPLKATITVIDNITKNIQGIYRTNEKNGKFVMVLAPEKEYQFIINSDGYQEWTKSVNVSSKTQNILKNIRLIKQ